MAKKKSTRKKASTTKRKAPAPAKKKGTASNLRIGRKATEGSMSFVPRKGVNKYAAVEESVRKHLMKAGDALPVDVPEGKTAEQFRNALGTTLRRRFPKLTLSLRIMEGQKAVAIIKR